MLVFLMVEGFSEVIVAFFDAEPYSTGNGGGVSGEIWGYLAVQAEFELEIKNFLSEEDAQSCFDSGECDSVAWNLFEPDSNLSYPIFYVFSKEDRALLVSKDKRIWNLGSFLFEFLVLLISLGFSVLVLSSHLVYIVENKCKEGYLKGILESIWSTISLSDLKTPLGKILGFFAFSCVFIVLVIIVVDFISLVNSVNYQGIPTFLLEDEKSCTSFIWEEEIDHSESDSLENCLDEIEEYDGVVSGRLELGEHLEHENLKKNLLINDLLSKELFFYIKGSEDLLEKINPFIQQYWKNRKIEEVLKEYHSNLLNLRTENSFLLLEEELVLVSSSFVIAFGFLIVIIYLMEEKKNKIQESNIEYESSNSSRDPVSVHRYTLSLNRSSIQNQNGEVRPVKEWTEKEEVVEDEKREDMRNFREEEKEISKVYAEDPSFMGSASMVSLFK